MSLSAKSVRAIRKLERPRLLKTSLNIDRPGSPLVMEQILEEAELVCQLLSYSHLDFNIKFRISNVYDNFKLMGTLLEAKYKDALDRQFITFRDGSRDERLDKVSRLQLLELIETRAKNWQTNENMNAYYRQKFVFFESETINSSSISLHQSNKAVIMQNTGITQCNNHSYVATPQNDADKTFNKYLKLNKRFGKSYFKDEILIRNSDSGKVMGIKGRRIHMIEKLSDTVISFQRVNPEVKDRLVQITGPSEDSISNAKQLIQETIFRNASPIREKQIEFGSDNSLNSGISEENSLIGFCDNTQHGSLTNDDRLGEYKYTVTVDEEILKILGSNYDLVKTAKLLLDEFFAAQKDDNNLILSPLQETSLNDSSDSSCSTQTSESAYKDATNLDIIEYTKRISINPLLKN